MCTLYDAHKILRGDHSLFANPFGLSSICFSFSFPLICPSLTRFILTYPSALLRTSRITCANTSFLSLHCHPEYDHARSTLVSSLFRVPILIKFTHFSWRDRSCDRSTACKRGLKRFKYALKIDVGDKVDGRGL